MKWALVLCMLVVMLSAIDAGHEEKINHRRNRKDMKRANFGAGGNVTSTFHSHQTSLEIEISILHREKQRMEQLAQILRQVYGYQHIQGFYHTSKWRTFWKEVISEQLYLLDGRRPVPELNTPRYTNKIPWDMNNMYASLLNISDGLYLNVVGEDESHKQQVEEYINNLDLKHRNKVKVHYNRTITRYAYDSATVEKKAAYDANPELSCGEYSTIMRLRNYCIDQVKAGQKTLVYYMHSKGQCCQRNVTKDTPPQNEGVSAWREYMNAMIVEFPSICLRALMKGYLACGVENQDMHFSGNYWWADCAHVAQLPPLRKRYDFGEPEYFILRFHDDFGLAKQLGFQCGYSIFNCGVNLYDVPCSRERYRDRLNKYVHFKIGPNSVKGKSESLQICQNLVQQYSPYSERDEQLKAWYHSSG
jgi:hypothetical protein